MAIADYAWMSDALCVKLKLDPRDFEPTDRTQVPNKIRAVCHRCPVRAACDDHGRKTRDKTTIRAGIPLSSRVVSSSTPEYTCDCGVKTVRESGICRGCVPSNKQAQALASTRHP